MSTVAAHICDGSGLSWGHVEPTVLPDARTNSSARIHNRKQLIYVNLVHSSPPPLRTSGFMSTLMGEFAKTSEVGDGEPMRLAPERTRTTSGSTAEEAATHSTSRRRCVHRIVQALALHSILNRHGVPLQVPPVPPTCGMWGE